MASPPCSGAIVTALHWRRGELSLSGVSPPAEAAEAAVASSASAARAGAAAGIAPEPEPEPEL